MHCLLGLAVGRGGKRLLRQESDSCLHSHLAELASYLSFFGGHVECAIFIKCN